MENRLENLRELAKEVNLDLFYSINLFNGMAISLQGKASQETLKEISGYCDDLKLQNSNLEGFFEYKGTDYRVILTF